VFIFIGVSSGASSLSLWTRPEIAEKHSIFLDVKFAGFEFWDNFHMNNFCFTADYTPPLPLPFSAGIFMKIPDPNLTSFGIRAAYHIDLGNPALEVYIFYNFDFGFLRNDLLIRYGDEARPLRLYVFRAVVRYIFGKIFGIVIETNDKLTGIDLGLSVKIN
jgi:hypothetical protein